MKHPDYDRAFHETPEYIRTAIELGFVKGKKAMKMRHKMMRSLSVAAAVVLILGAAAFGASRLGTPHPDGTLPGRPLSGPADTVTPTPTVPPTSTPSPMPMVTPADTIEPEGTIEPTPMPEVVAADLWRARTVYSEYGAYVDYFHREAACGAQQLRREVDISEAIRDGMLPCPDCLPEDYALVAVPPMEQVNTEDCAELLYYTANGQYFHIVSDCSGMQGAAPHSVADAFADGKSRCPVCMDGWTFGAIFYETRPESTVTPMPTALIKVGESEQFVVSVATAAVDYVEVSEVFPGTNLHYDDTVYVAESDFDFYFHIDPECSRLPGPTPTTVYDAMSAGLGLCPVCTSDSWMETAASASVETENVAESELLFYYTDGGTYYHLTPNCSGMRGAEAYSLKSAISWGKLHCPVCIGDNTKVYWAPVPENDDDIVYGSTENRYYHINPECFGMRNTLSGSYADFIGKLEAPCPVCLPSLSGPVDSLTCFTAEGDPHYHSDSKCPSLRGDAQKLTEIEAQAAGKLRCHDCAACPVDSERTRQLKIAFNLGVVDAFPGYIFEREEVLNNGVTIWYVSDGDTARDAIYFNDGESITMGCDSFENEFFDPAFLFQLPEPFRAVFQEDRVPADSVFFVGFMYAPDGTIEGMNIETSVDGAFDYSRWILSDDGELEYSDEGWSDAWQ